MVDLVQIMSEIYPNQPPWFWFCVRYSPVFGALLLWCLFASRLRWAPANIPFERRLQTATVFLGLFAQLFAVQLTALLLIAPLIFGDTLLTRVLSGATAVYCGYIFFDKTPSRGGYSVSKVRRSFASLCSPCRFVRIQDVSLCLILPHMLFFSLVS